MKLKLFVLVLSLCLITGIAMATEVDKVLSEPNSGTTEGTSYDTGCSYMDSFLNNHMQHSHGIPSRENALGLGMDLEYGWTKNISSALEYKYDFANEEHSTYLVGKLKFGK